MANSDLAVRPAATSWGAVLGGWVATIGASVIFAPMVAGLLAVPGTPASGDIAVAVPVVLGLFLSYIVGGYVAGRMAGYRTSWHGMMTAFFTLFVLLVLMVLGIAADNGLFAASGIRSAADIIPGVRDLNLYALGDALTFGAILGFLAPSSAAGLAACSLLRTSSPSSLRCDQSRSARRRRSRARPSGARSPSVQGESSRPSVGRAAIVLRRTRYAPLARTGSRTGLKPLNWSDQSDVSSTTTKGREGCA